MECKVNDSTVKIIKRVSRQFKTTPHSALEKGLVNSPRIFLFIFSALSLGKIYTHKAAVKT